MNIIGKLELEHLKTRIPLNFIVSACPLNEEIIFVGHSIGCTRSFHPYSPISIDNGPINRIFSRFMVLREKKEIIPLGVTCCVVKLFRTDK